MSAQLVALITWEYTVRKSALTAIIGSGTEGGKVSQDQVNIIIYSRSKGILLKKIRNNLQPIITGWQTCWSHWWYVIWPAWARFPKRKVLESFPLFKTCNQNDFKPVMKLVIFLFSLTASILSAYFIADRSWTAENESLRYTIIKGPEDMPHLRELVGVRSC